MRTRSSRVSIMTCFLLFLGPALSYGQAEPTAPLTTGLPRVPDLARIPAATFLMGSPVENERSKAYRKAEKPQREVRVEEFWLGRFLVTAEEFCVFLNDQGNDGFFLEDVFENDWRTIRRERETYLPQVAAQRCPAYPVTWNGAVTYCQWLSGKFKHRFRLPTEAEWELVARGAELRNWPWGAEPPILGGYPESRSAKRYFERLTTGPYPALRLPDRRDELLPFYDIYGSRWSFRSPDFDRPWTKAPVGSYPRNATPEGVYDMLGHGAGQWCSDKAERAIARTPGMQEPAYVVRGMNEVVADRTPRYSLLEIMIFGDVVGPQGHKTPGRSWSRMGLYAGSGAMFRVATSERPVHHLHTGPARKQK